MGRSGGEANEFRLRPRWENPLLNVWADGGSFYGRSSKGERLVRLSVDGEREWESVKADEGYRFYRSLVELSRVVSIGENAIIGGARGVGEAVDNARVYAFDPAGGEILWMYGTEADGLHDQFKAVTSHGDAVLFGSDSTGQGSNQRPIVGSLAAESGSERWIHRYKEGFVSGVVPFQDRVYVGLTNGLWAHDLESGDVVESFDWFTGFRGLARSGGTLVALTNERLISFDLGHGEIAWEGAVDRSYKSRPAIDAHGIYAGAEAGWITAFSRETGETRWESRLNAQVTRQPVPAGDTLWVCDDRGYVYGLRRSDGRIVFEERLGESDLSIAVMDDVLLLDGDARSAFEITRPG